MYRQLVEDIAIIALIAQHSLELARKKYAQLQVPAPSLDSLYDFSCICECMIQLKIYLEEPSINALNNFSEAQNLLKGYENE